MHGRERAPCTPASLACFRAPIAGGWWRPTQKWSGLLAAVEGQRQKQRSRGQIEQCEGFPDSVYGMNIPPPLPSSLEAVAAASAAESPPTPPAPVDGGSVSGDSSDGGATSFASFSDDDDEDGAAPESRFDRRLRRVSALRDAGNTLLKQGDFKAARRKYESAQKALGKVPAAPNAAAEEKRRAATVAVLSNLSLAHCKLQQWNKTVEFAGEVLAQDPANVKALFRRATANLRLGNVERSVADLVRAADLDPSSAEIRAELARARAAGKNAAAEARRLFGGFLNKAAAGSLYADQEAKAAAERARKAAAEAAGRAEFEAENAKREAAGEKTFASFEEWREGRGKAAGGTSAPAGAAPSPSDTASTATSSSAEGGREGGERKAAGEKKRKTAPAPAAAPAASAAAPAAGAAAGAASGARAGPPAAAAAPAPSASSDDLELDEADRQIISETKKMGYCYFNNPNLSPEEKARIQAANLPQKLGDASGGGAGAAAPTPAAPATSPVALSEWNSKGTTYEEKDMSTWACDAFKKAVCAASAPFRSGSLRFMAENASVTGEAEVIVLRATKRYLYDFSSIQLLYRAVDGASDEVLASGSISLADVSNTAGVGADGRHEWMQRGLRVRPEGGGAADGAADAALRKAIEQCLREGVQNFEKAYHGAA